MQIEFEPKALMEYEWLARHHPKLFIKLNQLIANMRETPLTGLGKPEQLKHELSGYWSRRISDEHRIVYRIKGNCILIAQCRYHYKP